MEEECHAQGRKTKGGWLLGGEGGEGRAAGSSAADSCEKREEWEARSVTSYGKHIEPVVLVERSNFAAERVNLGAGKGPHGSLT